MIRRVILGLLVLVLLATGIGKALDLPGFARVLTEYRLWPEWALPIIALGLTVTELALAALLLHPATRRAAAMGTAAFALTGAMVLWLTLARGIALTNCGCFGVLLARPLTPLTPFEDLFLAGLALLLLVRVRRRRAA